MAIFYPEILAYKNEPRIRCLDVANLETGVVRTIKELQTEDALYTNLKLKMISNITEDSDVFDLAIEDIHTLIRKSVDNFIKIIKYTFGTFKRVYNNFVKKMNMKFKVNEDKIKEIISNIDSQFTFTGYKYVFRETDDEVDAIHKEIFNITQKLLNAKKAEDLVDIRNSDTIQNTNDVLDTLRAKIMPKSNLGKVSRFNFLTVCSQYFRDNMYDAQQITVDKEFLEKVISDIPKYDEHQKIIMKNCDTYKKATTVILSALEKMVKREYTADIKEEVHGYIVILTDMLKAANETVNTYISSKADNLNKMQMQYIQILKVVLSNSVKGGTNNG